MGRACVAIAILLLSLAARAGEPALRWQGLDFREVTSLAALPPAIRTAIGADRSGLAGVAEGNEPFNATDAIVPDRPTSRFITAGQAGDVWLVALQQGGIVAYVSVTEFAGGVERKHWMVRCCATTLAQILQQIAAKSAADIAAPKP